MQKFYDGMPSEISSPGHYPELYKKYLIEKKSRDVSYLNKNLNVCRSGEVFCDKKLLERSWDGEKKDYVIYIPIENETADLVYFRKLFKMAYVKHN